jgi:hypothetical protein
MEPTPSAPASSARLKHEWILIGIAVLLTAGFLTAEAIEFPAEHDQGKKTLWSFLAMAVVCLAQVGWISLDRRRRGREMGSWRFGVVLLGPLVIAIYLLVEYRVRALYLIPLMVGVYVATGLLYVGLTLAVGHFL